MNNTELIDRFTDHLKSNNKTVSTIVAYRKDIEQLSESNVNKSLINLTSSDIIYFLDYLKNSKKISLKTLSRKLNSIRTFYKFLEVNKTIDVNPSTTVNHPKVKNKKQRVLTKYEWLALREVSRDNERLFCMIELLLQTGLRISELSKLKLRDVNLDTPKPYLTVRSYSSNIERQVPVNLKLANVVNKYILNNPDLDDTLFKTKNGKPIEIRNIRSSIDRALVKAEIKGACVNDLRNTFIVYQLSQGMSLSKVAEIVGHRNVATTNKYLSLLDKKYKPSGMDEVNEL